jgi:signal transduction histidine kinase
LERVGQYVTRDAYGDAISLEEAPISRALRGETVTGANAVDKRIEGSDGRVYEMSISATPIRDAAGAIVGAVAVAREVTAQRQLERQVREQAAELEAIFESQADAVAVYDLQGRFVRANSALRDLLGLDADPDYTARPLDERTQRLQLYDEQGHLLPPEQWPHWRVLRGEVLAGGSAMEGRMRTVDGRELWVSTTGAPMRAPDGQATGTVLITRDVTARRALERQAAKQAAEQAAAAERDRLAHELHDTVTQEIFSASLLAESITRNWREHRAEAEAALHQLPALTRGALAGLRVLLLELRPTTLDDLPLSALLRQLAEAMSTRAKVPIAVSVWITGTDASASDGADGAKLVLPPDVKVVFYRVAQEALMNAAKHANARAISVQLRTRGAGKGKGRGRGNAKGRKGTGMQGRRSTLELEIDDDGQGFDPTAIPAGHFGLAMMRERALTVDATLQVRSQPGQGTQIVAAWHSGHDSGHDSGGGLQAARQAAALHRKAAPHE